MFYAQPVQIINGTCMYNGIIYNGND
jgi:hypothetical protein